MKLKLDENIGMRGIAALRADGHDVATVHEQALTSAAGLMMSATVSSFGTRCSQGSTAYSLSIISAKSRAPHPVGPSTKHPPPFSATCTPAMSRWHHGTFGFTK